MGIARVARPLAIVVTVALAMGLAAVGDASAQDVQGLQATADRLAAQLDKLEARASELDEQYLSTGQEMEQVKAQISQNQAAVDDAKARMEEADAQADSYVVSAYMGAGAGAQVALGAGDPNQAVNQKVLLETLQGDRQQVSDDLRAARMDLEDRSADLEASTKELADKQAEQRSIKAELDASVAEQQDLLSGANAELQSAIKAEQERREAEAAAKAEAEARARQEAAAKAAQQAAAQQAAAQQAAARTAATQRPAAAAPAGGAAAPRATTPKAAAPRPAAPPPAPISAPNGGAAAAIAAAQSVLGTPYRWAGASPSSGFDCSGLTSWAWARAGVSLPHSSGAQYAATQRVPLDQLQPGDLVFFGSPIHHVGLYIGGGQMIHSPHTGDVVKVASISRGFGSAIGGGRVR